MDDKRRKMICECSTCENKRIVPGNCHIQCAKPDPEMTGKPYGIENGWFEYPSLFDPVWKTKLCSNYKSKIDPPKITMGPSKNGSKYCANAEGGRNGSVASGGTIEYCTCDRCF